jgi:hypothetical protein
LLIFVLSSDPVSNRYIVLGALVVRNAR